VQHYYYFKEPRIFIDSGAMIAVYDPSDRHHKQAIDFRNQVLLPRRIRLLSSKPIFFETIENLLRKVRARRLTEQRLRLVWGDFTNRKTIELHDPTEDDVTHAWEILRKYKDQRFSLVDSIALSMIRRMQLENIFAFDKHLGNFSYIIGHSETINLNVLPY